MVRTYDAKKVLISLGSHSVKGYSDSTFVSIEASGDGFTKKTGCDGEVVRSADPDKTARVTLTVLVNSDTVEFCQQQYNRDRETLDGMFPILVKDLKGGIIFAAEQAWVVNSPTRDFDKDGPDREIIIDTGEASWEGEVYS